MGTCHPGGFEHHYKFWILIELVLLTGNKVHGTRFLIIKKNNISNLIPMILINN